MTLASVGAGANAAISATGAGSYVSFRSVK
jgi:hypothetical protein